MPDAIETITTDNGYVIELHPDPDTEQPFDGDSGGVKIAILHRRYINPAAGELDTQEEIEAFEEAAAEKRAEWITFPLWLFDHSGTTYRIGEGRANPFGTGDYARFDSGRVGIIALRRKAWGGDEAALRKAAEGVARTYTAWANGETLSYIIRDADGDLIDSCGGYYGRDDALSAARENVPDEPTTPTEPTAPDMTYLDVPNVVLTYIDELETYVAKLKKRLEADG